VRDAPAPAPWRGDEHHIRIEAAKEAGLDPSEAELDSYTSGFRHGIVLDDPADGAIVARGRTVLREPELRRTLRPMLRFLGVSEELVALRVFDGGFELRIAATAAEASKPMLDDAKLALQIWIGFGLLGLAALQFIGGFAPALLWSAGLLLGAWQLRRGLASGRAMLGARLALGLGMLATQERMILPPAPRADADALPPAPPGPPAEVP
jgi:hypothetical protein